MNFFPTFRFLILLVLVLAHSSLPAQTPKKEASLEERLLRPEIQGNHALQARSFQTASNLQTKSLKEDKQFRTSTANQAGTSFEAPTFLGLKVPWLAKKKLETESFTAKQDHFQTKPSNLTNRENRQEKSFFAADRSTSTVRRAVPVESASIPGSAQTQINDLHQRAQRPLSVDEVRELLNKPR